MVSQSKLRQPKEMCMPGHLTFRKIIITSNIGQDLRSLYCVLGALGYLIDMSWLISAS